MQTEVRVGVFARDAELRSWLVDELALISPTIEVQTMDVLDVAAVQLLIVDLDALTLAEAEQLRELVERRTPPVIAIGAPTGSLVAAPFVCVLDATLTSKQLRRAVRETLAAPRPASPPSRA